MQEQTKITVIDDKMREEEAASLCKWATARAGVIVVAPLLGTMALMANQIYLICKLGKVYEEKISESAAVSLLSSLGATYVGQTAATLLPFAPLQIPIAMGTTYGLGRVVTQWLKTGKPKDMSAFKTIYADAVSEVKKNIDVFKNNPKKDDPLGDENKKFNE